MVVCIFEINIEECLTRTDAVYVCSWNIGSDYSILKYTDEL